MNHALLCGSTRLEIGTTTATGGRNSDKQLGRLPHGSADEVQDKVLWLPCVATGVMKTNISAKMMTLVSDKRREGHAELDRAETKVNVYGRDYAREPRRSTQAAPGGRCLNEPRTALRKHKLGDWNFQVLQTPS